jgi:hypothetical protein
MRTSCSAEEFGSVLTRLRQEGAEAWFFQRRSAMRAFPVFAFCNTGIILLGLRFCARALRPLPGDRRKESLILKSAQYPKNK